MCGINGQVRAQVKMDLIHAMNEKMIFRGPDDEGLAIFENVGLGMRRLSIIDIKGGHQPIMDDENILVFNGEIYNYKTLKQSLEGKYQFKTSSDSEVLFYGLKEKGSAFISELVGMFAFAFLDKKKGKLLIARDQLGVKPLFFSHTEDAFSFSSNLDSLKLCLKETSISLDAFIDYSIKSFTSSPQTIYQGILKLEPGHFLEVDTKKVSYTKKRFWDVRLQKQNPSQNLEKDFFKLFDESVTLMLQSDVPVGVFLSGGVDSSLVVARAAKILGEEKLNTFSIGFKGGNYELPLAKLVAQKYKTNHHEFVLDGKDSLQIFKEAIPFMDEPLMDNAFIPTLFLSKKVRELGVKVVLTGAGGDELFGGYPRYLSHEQKFNPMKNSAGLKLAASMLNFLPDHRLKYLQRPELYYCANMCRYDLDFLKAFVNKSLESYKTGFEKHLQAFFADKNPQHLQLLDLKHYLVDDILSIADKMTMGASIEGRVPFLDHRLVEWAFSLSEKDIYQSNELKGLLKFWAKPYLPEEIFSAPKRGFTGPFSDWVQNFWQAEIKISLLEKPCQFFREHCHISAIKGLFENIGNNPNRDATLLSLFVFNEWSRYHVDGVK